METMPPISSRSLQYYVIAKRWLSDLEFFRQESGFLHELLYRYVNRLQESDLEFLKLETGFMHELLDRYMNRLPEQEYVKKLVSADNALRQLEQLVTDDLLSGQITQLELMAEDVIPEDAEALAANQVKLELFMNDLMNRFRTVKLEIYRLVLDMKRGDQLIAN